MNRIDKNTDMTIQAIANIRKTVNTFMVKFVKDCYRMENVKMEALVD